MIKKILLTGASGFLGNYIAKKLIQNNYNILALSRRKINSKSPRLKWLKCDLSDRRIVKKIFPLISEVEYVVHAAAQIPQRKDEKALSFVNNNINATMNLLESLPLNIRQFIYCSSIDVYGNRNTIPINEDNLIQPLTYYGATKLFSEHLVNIYFIKKPTVVTCLRFTQLYGPQEPKIKIIPRLIEYILKEKEILIENEGQDIRDYLFVEDAADAVIECIAKPLHGVFNISSGKGVTIQFVIKTLEKISGKKLKVAYLPIKKISGYILDNKKFCTATDWRPIVNLYEGLKKEYKFAQESSSKQKL